MKERWKGEARVSVPYLCPWWYFSGRFIFWYYIFKHLCSACFRHNQKSKTFTKRCYSNEIDSLLVTLCKITRCSLQNLLVTCCRSCALQKNHSLLVAKFARYSLQKMLVAKNHSLLIAKFALHLLQKITRYSLHC